MKKRVQYAALLFLLPAGVLLMACAAPAAGDDAFLSCEVVEDVPRDLTHWLHTQLHLNKDPAAVFQSLDEHIYILATLGDRSRQGGSISLTEEDGGEEGLYLQLVYHYNEGAPAAADPHFMILKAPRDIIMTLDLQDGVTNSNLAALRKN